MNHVSHDSHPNDIYETPIIGSGENDKKHAILDATYDWNTPRYVWWNADIQA